MEKNRTNGLVYYRLEGYFLLLILWCCNGANRSDVVYENVCGNGNFEILKSSEIPTRRSNKVSEKSQYIIKSENQTITIDSNYTQLATTLFLKENMIFESNCYRHKDLYFVTFMEFCCLNLLVFEIRDENLILKRKYKFTSSFTWINLDREQIYYLTEVLPDSSNSISDINQIVYREGLLDVLQRDSVIIEAKPKLSDLDFYFHRIKSM